MIDSIVWKEKLAQDVFTLKKRLLQRRWSGRSIVLFERELMLIFFSIRALIEAGKLTDRVSQKVYKLITYRNKGKIVDDISKFDVDEVFDLESGIENEWTLKLLTNQFIHAYVMFTEFSEEAKVIGILLCSDWEKTRSLIRVPITLVIEIVEDVSADDIKEIRLVRNEKTGGIRKEEIL